MYDNPNTVEKTFDQEFLSEYLRQAQWAEMVELKKAIGEICKRKGGPIAILDIGIGNARIPKHLSGIKEIWDMVGSYDGIDNAQNCVGISQRVVSEMGLGDKVSVRQLDAANLGRTGKKYDLIIITWFTAGNFYPDDFRFEGYGRGTGRYDLSRNPKFERIFRLAHRRLNPGGEIIIGSAYKDNEGTRIKQEDVKMLAPPPVADRWLARALAPRAF
ncbi:MAG: class I SAM-dependent methyltransferase [Candidatus Micrarchaeota archaeon]